MYKFGGASLADAEQIRNVSRIVEMRKGDPLLLVVSAMGKMTNNLEKVVDLYFNEHEKAMPAFRELVVIHANEAKNLGISLPKFYESINEIVVSVEWLLEIEPEDPYNYVYDQIISAGELLSSKLLALHLENEGKQVQWIDVRDVIKSDDRYREAGINWELTQNNVNDRIKNLLVGDQIVVLQGFIASTIDNNTTTLGREGSDFTGAIFAFCLDADGLYIWKNVPGVLTGDPTRFEKLSKIDRMSYKEAIEMTYYGAKVIHPKTIKPLQNKSIPLYVKSFVNPEESGTTVAESANEIYPPVVVVEDDQALMHISTKDFSFVAEDHLKEIFTKIAELRIKVNLMRNTAISFTICISSRDDKLEKLRSALEPTYKIITDKGLQLISIRHYNNEIVDEMRAGKMVYFEEKLESMVQMVVKQVPLMSIKK